MAKTEIKNKPPVFDQAASIMLGQTCVCFNLRKAARLVTQTYDEFLRPAGIKGTQFSLLAIINGFKEITINELARQAIMDRTTVSRNLKPLENKGLLKIKLGRDKRERVVTLTKKGTKNLARALPLWEKAQNKIIEAFGIERTDRVVSELSSLVAELRAS